MLSAVGLSGYDVDRGSQLWHYPWKFARGQKIICAQPAALADFGYAAGRDRVLMTAGYGIGSELVNPMNATLASLQLDGYLDYLMTKWFFNYQPAQE